MMKKMVILSDLYTSFELEKFSNNDAINDAVKLEFIKEIIAHAKSDKQATFMYIAFALAFAVFVFNKIASFTLMNVSSNVISYCGITMLLMSALFFFVYWRKIHRCQLTIISCIPHLNIEKARDSWTGLWFNNQRYFKIGLILLAIGVFVMFATLIVEKIVLFS